MIVFINVKNARIKPNYFKTNAFYAKFKVTYSIIIENESHIEANCVKLIITRDSDHFAHKKAEKN
jgi:hypothetical protein